MSSDSLRQLSALSHFSLEQYELLASAARFATASPEQTVVRHGDSGADLFGILRGDVRIQRETPHGVFKLARLKGGDLFGETSFIDSGERSTDVVAEGECELAVFGAYRLRRLCEEHKRFELALYWALWSSASKKLRITNRMLAHYFSSDEPGQGETRSSVGVPKQRGDRFPIDSREKRDLFLDLGLSHMEANFMATLSQAERFDPSETIFREGEPGNKLYVILEGEVRISKNIPGTGEEALAILGRGEIFGEMALVDGRPRSADAVAHDAGAELLVIRDPVLAGLLDIEKISSLRLLKVLCRNVAKRLRVLDEKIVGWYMLSGGSDTVVGRPDEQPN